SDGAFDPTVGPLVNLWGFGPAEKEDTDTPSDETIAAAKDQVGWQKIERRDDGHKIYQPGDVYLDLSAIAKGYAVDLLGEHLTELGVESWIVDIGGDLRTHGKKADGNPWYIGVE